MQWSLNKAQKGILIVSLALISFSFLFPCWEWRNRPDFKVIDRVDYQFILAPPKRGTRPFTIDYGRMLTQMLVVMIVGGGLIALKKS